MLGKGLSEEKTSASSDERALRLVLACDRCFISEALAKAFEDGNAQFKIEIGCGVEAVLRLVSGRAADAILMDGERANLALANLLRVGAPRIPIIAFGLRETLDDVVAWAEAGATGYIAASVGLGDFPSLVRDVIAGEQSCAGSIAAGLFRRLVAGARPDANSNAPPQTNELTRREMEIAELIATGLTDKEISRRLSVSLATTKTHVHHLLGKLNVRRRSEVNAVWFGSYRQTRPAA